MNKWKSKNVWLFLFIFGMGFMIAGITTGYVASEQGVNVQSVQQINCFSASPEGKQLIVCKDEGMLIWWDSDSHRDDSLRQVYIRKVEGEL